MKKIILMAVAFVSFATITSCSKSDDQAALTGKWEQLREGVAANGQEVLQDYVHESGCSKDYVMITATTVVDHSFYNDGTGCAEDIYTSTYTRSGNTITISSQGFTSTAEIKTLDSNTLKIYYVDSDFPTVSQVSVLKRVN